jgi:flagellar biogenesis protein FliO
MTDLLFPLLALFVIVVYVVNRIRSNRRYKK